MSDSTSILDLPTDPVGGGNVSNNIQITAHDTKLSDNGTATMQPSGVSLDQSTINQIVNGLQQASLSGSTNLQSRDIPMTTSNYVNDPQTAPNYIPPPPQGHSDYIKNYEQPVEMINNYNNKMNLHNNLDNAYNDFQTPFLLTILYFLFQLPFFKKILYAYIPRLFSNDGNYNINGYLFASVLFGLLFHVLSKTTMLLNFFT
jgi:hypothetical protein